MMNSPRKTSKSTLVGIFLIVANVLPVGAADTPGESKNQSATADAPATTTTTPPAKEQQFNWKQFFPNGLVNAANQKVSPDTLNGKYVVLYFSASWCGPCKQITPKLVALRNHAKEQMEVVLVSFDRSKDDQFSYMKHSNMEWPATNWSNSSGDENSETRRLAAQYHANWLPTMVVLSPTGELVAKNACDDLRSSPAARIQELKSYDYQAHLNDYNSQQLEQGIIPTKEEEEKVIAKKRSQNEQEIERYKKTLADQQSAQSASSEASAWQQLLTNYFETTPSLGRKIGPIVPHLNADGTASWEDFFPNGLVNANGEEISPTVLNGKYVALYFSASWCGPCRTVTPKLVTLRDQVKDHLEVVLVCTDESETDQYQYMKDSKMNWLAVKWAERDAGEDNEVKKLIRQHSAYGKIGRAHV